MRRSEVGKEFHRSNQGDNDMTLAAIRLFLANVWGYIVAHWRWFLYGFLAIALLLLVVFAYRGCRGSKKATIDLESVTKINNADRKERLEELEKTVIQNQDVIESASNRTALTDLDIETRRKEVQAKVDAADKKVMEAKEQGRGVTQEELQCILVPEDCK